MVPIVHTKFDLLSQCGWKDDQFSICEVPRGSPKFGRISST